MKIHSFLIGIPSVSQQNHITAESAKMRATLFLRVRARRTLRHVRDRPQIIILRYNPVVLENAVDRGYKRAAERAHRKRQEMIAALPWYRRWFVSGKEALDVVVYGHAA